MGSHTNTSGTDQLPVSRTRAATIFGLCWSVWTSSYSQHLHSQYRQPVHRNQPVHTTDTTTQQQWNWTLGSRNTVVWAVNSTIHQFNFVNFTEICRSSRELVGICQIGQVIFSFSQCFCSFKEGKHRNLSNLAGIRQLCNRSVHFLVDLSIL